MDIVERLGELRLGNKEYDVVVDAIDEIEKLREKRSRYREALREISCDCDIHCRSDGVGCDQWIARAALKDGE